VNGKATTPDVGGEGIRIAWEEKRRKRRGRGGDTE
jgi:hypothetical protein